MRQTEMKSLDVSLNAIQERLFTFNYDYNPEGFDIKNLQYRLGVNIIPKIDDDILGVEVVFIFIDSNNSIELAKLQIALLLSVKDLGSIALEEGDQIIFKSKEPIRSEERRVGKEC